jgi:hypothetical protein
MGEETFVWFKRRLGANLIFIEFLAIMVGAAFFTYLLYLTYLLNYLLVVFGGFLTGITAISVTLAQDIQYRRRVPKVFFHTNKEIKMIGKKAGLFTFPIFLKNIGLVPGHNVLVILSINPKNGEANISDVTWEEITNINQVNSSEKIFQHRVKEAIYPFLEKGGGVFVGELSIKHGENNNFDIEVTARVYEERGVTEETCRFAKDGVSMDNDIRVDCEKLEKFSSYF